MGDAPNTRKLLRRRDKQMTKNIILATFSAPSERGRAGLLESNMNGISRVLLAFGLAVTMVAPAIAADPTGLWRPDKTSDYDVTLCGNDNTQLCIKVVKLAGAMDTPQNRPYLNQVIVNKAKPSGANRWKGKMNLFGQSGDATVTLRGENDLLIKVCAYIVVCREYPMTRAQ